LASVWVPFTSESKEAIASYPEIQKELRLALQAVGRKLGIYMNRRERVKQQGERRGERRSIFLRYLGEVASAIHKINGVERDTLYNQLLEIAKSKTSEADMQIGEDGKPINQEEIDLGENVLIVDNPDITHDLGLVANRISETKIETETE